jgi:uncharacterized protein YebE (UPF0316 family)
MIYLIILVLKIIEVSIGTLRIVLITRGERISGACLGFVEVMLWVFLVSTVLNNISEDPIKIIIYASGFAVGNFVGSLLEQMLGIGNSRIEVNVLHSYGEMIANKMRVKGYGVTVIEGKGMESDRDLIVMNVSRKNVNEIVNTIKAYHDKVVITISDIKPVYGGYGLLKK